MAALLAALAFALPATATEQITKSKVVNCKVGEAPAWVTNEGFKCQSITGLSNGVTITSHVPECPDGWHLVLTQAYAPMCAWVLREPGH